jgi:hypothetical protein
MGSDNDKLRHFRLKTPVRNIPDIRLEFFVRAVEKRMMTAGIRHWLVGGCDWPVQAVTGPRIDSAGSAPDIRTPLARVRPLVRVHGALVHGQVAGLRAAVVALVARCLGAVRVRVCTGAVGEAQ